MMNRVTQWIPTLAMMLVSLISYIDRNTLALLAPTILKESGLSVEQYGFIISAFSVSYMIGNPVWGRLLDRFGLRVGMAAAVFFWTLASTSHAFAAGFLGFAVARAALGFFEGATFPGGLRAAMQTLPEHLRGRGMALSYSGGSLGAIVTPLIVTPVAFLWGWQGAFLFTGAVGLAWLALWVLVSRRDDIASERFRASLRTKSLPPGWRDRQVWSFMAAYALGCQPLAFVLYAAALYLNRAMGISQVDIGKVLWLPPLGWEVGYFIWGWLTDRALRSGNPLPAFRRLLLVSMLLSLPLAATPFITSFPLVMAVLFFAMFVAAGFIIVPIRYATHAYSADHAGLIAGLGAGSWGAMVALTMPVFGYLFDQQRYDQAFLMAALFPVAGYIIWWWLNRDRELLPAAGV
ncbi:MAG: MFS transporter [Acidobacteriia bacterium]|nr:MFS transporter [Terriglobia bacterium]